jgi:hypothetical protein
MLIVVAGIGAVALVWWIEDKYLPEHQTEGYRPRKPQAKPLLAITYVRPLLLEYHPRQAAVVLDFGKKDGTDIYALDEAA